MKYEFIHLMVVYKLQEHDKWSCALCRISYTREDLVQRHVQEYHSGFTYICMGCNRSFTRRNYNHKCNKSDIKMQDFDIVSPDGARGDKGFEQYRVWKRTMQNKLIVREGGVRESEEHQDKTRKENDKREDQRQRD